MAVQIKSLLSSGPLWVSLASGATVRISPGQTSEEVPDVEVQNNPQVDKLRNQRLIEVVTVTKDGGRRTKRVAATPEKTRAAEQGAAKADKGGGRDEGG